MGASSASTVATARTCQGNPSVATKVAQAQLHGFQAQGKGMKTKVPTPLAQPRDSREMPRTCLPAAWLTRRGHWSVCATCVSRVVMATFLCGNADFNRSPRSIACCAKTPLVSEPRKSLLVATTHIVSQKRARKFVQHAGRPGAGGSDCACASIGIVTLQPSGCAATWLQDWCGWGWCGGRMLRLASALRWRSPPPQRSAHAQALRTSSMVAAAGRCRGARWRQSGMANKAHTSSKPPSSSPTG